MVGASAAALTAKGVLPVTEPDGVVTVIGPDAAPSGTVATSCVAVAEVTSAGTPSNVTLFPPGVELNPVPCRVIAVPTALLLGTNSMIERAGGFRLSTASTFPTAS